MLSYIHVRTHQKILCGVAAGAAARKLANPAGGSAPYEHRDRHFARACTLFGLL